MRLGTVSVYWPAASVVVVNSGTLKVSDQLWIVSPEMSPVLLMKSSDHRPLGLASYTWLFGSDSACEGRKLPTNGDEAALADDRAPGGAHPSERQVGHRPAW